MPATLGDGWRVTAKVDLNTEKTTNLEPGDSLTVAEEKKTGALVIVGRGALMEPCPVAVEKKYKKLPRPVSATPGLFFRILRGCALGECNPTPSPAIVEQKDDNAAHLTRLANASMIASTAGCVSIHLIRTLWPAQGILAS